MSEPASESSAQREPASESSAQREPAGGSSAQREPAGGSSAQREPAGEPSAGGESSVRRGPGIAEGEHELPTVIDTERFGEELGGLLGAGDLVLLAGPLGAGKTALVRGLARGLGVRGAVTSPTFVIAREHPPSGDGPALVHVDAYRLGLAEGADVAAELDDLDLDTDLTSAVVAVEWGAGVADRLSERAVTITLERRPDDVRVATVRRTSRP